MAKKKQRKPTVTAMSIERDRQRLPLTLSDRFGRLGFVKWTSAYCPVMVVDPMKMVLEKCLPEGIYHAWMYKVDLYASEGSADRLPALIYWYGTTFEFSIVSLSKVVSWGKGCEEGYDEVPEFMSRRMESGRAVSAAMQLCQDALEDLTHNGLHIAPEDRSSVILAPRRKSSVQLNEWHALALEDPPQRHSWLEKRDNIFNKLPNREYFGTIGFLPFAKAQHIHPVLILSPFRVPPGPIRTEWFHKCSSRQMVLVYWLGAYTSGRQQGAYSFHYLNQIVSWDEGKGLGHDELPPNVLEVYEKASPKNKNISKPEISHYVDWLVCGHWELKPALAKDPEDRWGGLEDFEEDHDDDFDYYWECIEAAEQAIQVKEQEEEARITKPTKLTSNVIEMIAAKAVHEEEKDHSIISIPDDSPEPATPQDAEEVGQQDPITIDLSKSSSPKRKTSPKKIAASKRHSVNQSLKNGIKAPPAAKLKSDESSRQNMPLRKSNDVGRPSFEPRMENSGSDRELDDEARISNIMGVASVPQQETASTDFRRQERKRKASKSQPRSHSLKNGVKLRSAAKLKADEPSRQHMPLRESHDIERPSVEPRMENSGSDKELDDEVRSGSIMDVASVHQQETESAHIRRQERKRKAVDDANLSNGSSTLATWSFQADRILELKRRKEETQQVVHQVIKEWTQKKMNSKLGTSLDS
jgi:hypothetical protein